jgi:hypothetical protein
MTPPLKLSRVNGVTADCGHRVNDRREYLARGPGQPAEAARTTERGILVTGPVPVTVRCPDCHGAAQDCPRCLGDGVVVTMRKRTFCARCAVAFYRIKIHDSQRPP